jgi:hypothetical protein
VILLSNYRFARICRKLVSAVTAFRNSESSGDDGGNDDDDDDDNNNNNNTLQ